MEMSHQSGAEAESLLRPDQRGAVVMPGQRRQGSASWGAFLTCVTYEAMLCYRRWHRAMVTSMLPLNIRIYQLDVMGDYDYISDLMKQWGLADYCIDVLISWDENGGEKAPFLRNEPVKLTPAWEGTNLPNDTLNLKGVGMDLVPPADKWNLVYFTLMLHGLGTLTAWNMFITAKSYFEDYKLEGSNYYKDNYMVFVGWASQIPNLCFSWFNIFVNIGGQLSTRIVWALILEVLIFVLTIFLAMVDTTEYTVLFFWTTMVSVFFLNGFNAIFQNSVFGIAARLPPSYTGAVVLGSNICGTLVALLNMTTKLASSPRTAAIYYFIGGMAVLLVCFDTYFALPLNRFYRYYETLQQRTLRNNPALAASNPPAPATPWATIFKQASMQLYNVFMIFTISLTVFPAVQSAIKMSDPDFFLGNSNFTSVGCFLTFNLTAMIGNITANLWRFPSAKWLWIFTTARIAFIPFFLLCNYSIQGRTMPILITNDWVYWLGGVLLGWSSGHGSSLAMMYVGGTVAPEFASKAGMIGGATLVTGIVVGITISGLGPAVVKLDLWKTM